MKDIHQTIINMFKLLTQGKRPKHIDLAIEMMQALVDSGNEDSAEFKALSKVVECFVHEDEV